MEDENKSQYWGANTSSVWLCLEKTEDGVSGIFLTPSVRGRISFLGLDGLILALNEVFDTLHFPQRFFARRRITQKPLQLRMHLWGYLRKPVRDEEMWRRAQDVEARYLLCCYLHIDQRKHASWQGHLWLPWQSRGCFFGSALQLMEQLDAAVLDMTRVTMGGGGGA